jgi:hypothetical protein
MCSELLELPVAENVMLESDGDCFDPLFGDEADD